MTWNSDLIMPGSEYGNARIQAAAARVQDRYAARESQQTVHGLTSVQMNQLHGRMNEMMPRLASTDASQQVRSLFDDTLPKGATWDARRTGQAYGMGGMGMPNAPGGSGGGGGSMYNVQRPYQPEFECIPHGTTLVLADGTRKKVEAVQAGDNVLDKNGHVQTVLRIESDGVPTELIEFQLWGGTTLRSTKDHNWPVWAWHRDCLCGCGERVKPGRLFLKDHGGGAHAHVYIDGCQNTRRVLPAGYEPLQKLRAADVNEHDFLLMPRKFSEVATDASHEQAVLLGYYAAEGCPEVCNDDHPGFILTLGLKYKIAWLPEITETLSALSVSHTVQMDPEHGAYNIRTVSDYNKDGGAARRLTAWLMLHAGVYAENKRLSEEVMRWPIDLKETFVVRLFRGDGGVVRGVSEDTKGYEGTQFNVNWGSASEVLCDQVQLLLAQLGYPTRKTIVPPSEGKNGLVRNTYYRLTVSGEYAEKLAVLVWEGSDYPYQHERKNKVRHACRVDDDYVYIPIKSVCVVPNDVPVYKLSVSGDHSYLVDNIGTYNSPDRQQYPVHRILANRYWRLFIKLDPIIGTGLDMYSEMCWSDCKLTGEGVEGEVREVYESMWEACNVLTLLPAMTREFIGLGEVVPHCFFDDAEGMWTYIALHNPDNLEVIDAPFIKMEPIVEFVPDDRLRAILTSSDPELQGIREKMPPELIAKLYSRQNIRINTDVNATFLARKLHPYETRGTSILSRMWRILMYEDAIFNASIATARRHAGPIKIAKLGNPQTNWIPGPEQERRFAELVAQAEMDPHAWIIYHYGVQLEAFGTTDRVMTINREWEVIERIKLAAMGISRSFLTGELTFASATAGLQVFLRRLLSLRSHFETLWLRPKFFKPIAEINQFYRRDKAELDHGIRIKRTAQEIREQKRLIVPKIEWANKLNPMVDKDLISAYEQLERMGIRISKTKKHASVNLQYEEELRRSLEEDKFENAVRKEYGEADEAGNADELAKIITHTDESLTTDEKEKEEGGQDTSGKPKGPPPNPMKGASRTAAENDPNANGAPWDEQGNAYGWRKEEVDGLIELLTTGETESAFWSLLEPTAPEGEAKDLITRSGDEPKPAQGDTPYSALQAGDPDTCWVMIDDFLQDQGYPEVDIQGLQRVLMAEKVLPSTRTAALDAFFTSLPDDSSNLSDKEFGNRFAKSLEKRRPFADRSSARHLARPDNFLVGEESAREAGRRRGGTLFSDGFAKAEHAENCSCCKTAIKTPDFDPPANHEAREEWQRGLQHSKIPQDAKNYIRQIENEFTDGWMASFDILWKDLESRIDKGQRLEPGMIGAIISDQVRKQMNLVDLEHVTNAFTGLYSEGKDFAYKPTGYREKKLETLRKRSSRVAFVREAITIDTHEDKLMLDHIKQTALKKVKTITDKDMLQSILQGLSEPGASNKNPLQLADEIVRSEADKRRLQTDYYDADARTTLKNQLSDLYENQLWKVQRIMRTEAVNGFVVAQLQGYKEQGIVKVMWNSHHDSRVCSKCRALDGTTFEVDTMMSNNNRYPISTESHPNCRCWLTPVISYVTFEQFSEQWDKTHPTKFIQGEPVFDETKLTPSDVIQDELGTKLTQFIKVPVEHVDPLSIAVKNIELSPLASSAPKNVEFVRDVYDTDAFQLRGKPAANLSGQVVSWHDKENDTTLISGYAAEYDKIGDVYTRAWLQQAWEDHPETQNEWYKLYDRTPARASVPAIDPVTVQVLKTTLGVYPVGQTYYTDKGEAVGLTKKFRDLSNDNAAKRLKAIGIAKDDTETIVKWRRSVPLWSLKTGDSVADASEDDDSKFITFEASLNPQAFFRESCIAYVNRPWPLLQKDPDLYEIIKDKVFGGKEFR